MYTTIGSIAFSVLYTYGVYNYLIYSTYTIILRVNLQIFGAE